MGTPPVKLTGITPYLHYDSLLPMVEWLTRVFGFTEKARWLNAAGIATHATLRAGSTELWLDGDPKWWQARGRQPDEWLGVWVDDVDAMHARVKAAGLSPAAPEHKFYGVRMFQVTDPQGYTWGFMQDAPFVAHHLE